MTMRPNEIEKCANEVLDRFNISRQPYQHIKTICDSEKITIKRTAFRSNMDGAFSVIENQKYIFYNSTMIIGRQNFTKAHELGHYFLNHSLENGNAIYCYSQNISENNTQSVPKIETEANYFAACFLMPKRLMLQCFFDVVESQMRTPNRPLYVDSQPCNKDDWRKCCNYFHLELGVSKEALRYRMEQLGLLDYRLDK